MPQGCFSAKNERNNETCFAGLAELMEELAIERGELERDGGVTSESAQHLEVHRAQLSARWGLVWRW